MNRSYSKIRHIQEANQRLEKRLLKEDDQKMQMLQQETQEFNDKVGEDLSPEEYKELTCLTPDDIDSELPANISNEEKQKLEQIKERMKTASFSELMQMKKQLKELKRQSKQQMEQAAETALVSLLGVSVPPAFAMVIGGILFLIVLSFLSKLLGIRKTETYWCDGKKSHLFGLLRW